MPPKKDEGKNKEKKKPDKNKKLGMGGTIGIVDKPNKCIPKGQADCPPAASCPPPTCCPTIISCPPLDCSTILPLQNHAKFSELEKKLQAVI